MSLLIDSRHVNYSDYFNCCCIPYTLSPQATHQKITKTTYSNCTKPYLEGTPYFQAVKYRKNHRLFLLDWESPPVLAEKIHLTNHIVMGVYNPLHPQSGTLIQLFTHARRRFIMRGPLIPSEKSPQSNPMCDSQLLVLPQTNFTLPCLTQFVIWQRSYSHQGSSVQEL